MILAISPPADPEADAVLGALRRQGARALRLDLADFPARAGFRFAYGTPGADLVLEAGGETIRADDLTTAWWWRPNPPAVDPALPPRAAGFALRQTGEAIHGFLASLQVRWVNHPWTDEPAGHKPNQLAAAERVGLAVPPTLITNDADRARAFLVALEGRPAVEKTLHCTPDDWRPTRLLDPEDAVSRLAALRIAPAILQAYVPGVDVRVTVIGDELFAAEIDARETRSPHDFRPAWQEARFAPCRLPEDVATRLRTLVASLGLRYAAIDLRRRDDGEHLFLEVNPGGRFLFVEERTRLPITDALAALLASG